MFTIVFDSIVYNNMHLNRLHNAHLSLDTHTYIHAYTLQGMSTHFINLRPWTLKEEATVTCFVYLTEKLT